MTFKGASDYTSGLDTLEEIAPKQMAVVGFLTNELVARCAEITEDEAELTKIIKMAGMDYTEALKLINKEARVMVVLPFPRVLHKWTFTHLPMLHEVIRLNLCSETNITVIPYLPVVDVDYSKDGIHLSPECCALPENRLSARQQQ